MKIIHVLSFAISLGSLSTAVAHPLPSPKEPQEAQKNLGLASPSFLGFALNQPFPGDMQECPKYKYSSTMVDHEAMSGMRAPCYNQTSPDLFEVWNGPDLNIGHLLVIQTFQGKPIIFRMKFGKNRFSELADIFSAKYGPAAQSKKDVVWTGNGTPYPRREMLWQGSHLRIKLTEIGEDIRWGEAVIENVVLANIVEIQKKETTKNSASRL